MNLARKVMDAMNDIDEELLAQSEMTEKKKRSWLIPSVSLITAAAALIIAVNISANNSVPTETAAGGMNDSAAKADEYDAAETSEYHSEEESAVIPSDDVIIKLGDTAELKDEDRILIRIEIFRNGEAVTDEIKEDMIQQLSKDGCTVVSEDNMIFETSFENYKDFEAYSDYGMIMTFLEKQGG